MQCPNCGASNPDNKKYCTGCGSSLRLRCSACNGENPPQAKFCGDCGASLAAAVSTDVEQASDTSTLSVPEAERRQLTVMFCDLVGSTELTGQLDPEDLRGAISEYQLAVGRAVDRYEGFVARYMGDGMLIYFGYPQAHEDDAVRAVHAGLEIVNELDELKVRFQQEIGKTLAVRIGVATGQVVVGEVIGKGASEEATVIGATPNLAARLQTLAEPNTVVVAQRTRELTAGRFEYTDRGVHSLKGFSEAVRAWRAVRVRPLSDRFQAQRTAGLVPLVGRDDVVGLLLRRWEEAKTGDGQVVLLSGEPGIGKSRIAHELRDRLEQEPHARVRIDCSPFHQNSALYPFIDQLERAAGFDPADTPDDRLDKLEALIAQSSEQPAVHVPLMAALLSVPTGQRYPPLDLLPAARRRKTLDALEAQLQGLTKRQPVLLIFEDAQWIDPTSLELLEQMIGRAEKLPVLIVVTARPEFTPRWTRFGHVTLLVLNHLSRRQCVEMVEKLTARKSLPESIQAQIVAKTQGVPLFIEELIKSVLESGILRTEADRYVLAEATPDLAIPATLQDSLMARLDRLGEVKELAQIGSVIGRQFDYGLLQRVVQLSEEALQRGMEKLEQSALVARHGFPPNAVYTFKHALIQDAAYQSLLKQTRRVYHEQIAHALEQWSPEIVNNEPELLAYHYTQAGLADKAIDQWLRAGERAAQHSANAEAISHLEKGLGLLEKLPKSIERDEREFRFLIVLGPALMATKGWDAAEVEQAYGRARQLARAGARAAVLFPAVWGLWLVAHAGGDAPTARRLHEELFALAEKEGDSVLLLQAHHAGGSTMCSDGELHRAQYHIEKGITLYRIDVHSGQALQYGGHDPCVCAHSLGALNQLMLGTLERSRQYSDQAVALAKRVGHAPSLAHGYWYRAELCQIHGEAEEAGKLAEVVRAVAIEKGMAQYAAWATMTLGWTLAMNGHARDGLEQVERGLEALRVNRTRYHLPHRLALVAQTMALAGDFEEAAKMMDEVLVAIVQTGERWFEAEALRLKASYLLRQPHPDLTAVQVCLENALAVARGQDAKFWELRAATDIAHLQLDQGKRKEAYDLLSPIYGWFTEGLDTADLRDARALLDALA